MTSDLQRHQNWRDAIEPWLRRIEALEQEDRDIDLTYGGLVELDVRFDLAQQRMEAALMLFVHSDPRDPVDKQNTARDLAVAAILELERLTSTHLTLDQGGAIRDDPRMGPIRDAFSALIAAGGGELFDRPAGPAEAEDRIVEIVTGSLLRHAGRERPSDTSGAPLADIADDGSQAADPADLEIDPGAEEIVTSDFMTLPISQAVLLLNDEVIPDLERQIAADPGNTELQGKVKRIREQTAVLE
ncbi:MAG: hypothetical protein E4H09_01200, partial [Spirochaetales bacterium]